MVYYVAFYNPKEEIGRRVANYAGEEKIDYICQVLNDLGENVKILSNTKSIDKRFKVRKEYYISKKKSILMFSTISNRNRIVHAIDVVWGYLQLSFYLLRHLKRNDTVLVYHSLGYRRLFNILARLLKFNYILEVEELFQFIDEANSFKTKEDTVFGAPSSYIFSNSIIGDVVNKDNKPNVVVNGIYKRQNVLENKSNEKIIVLYAGTLAKQKGVDYVIESARFLPENFEMHIIGFGSSYDLKRVNDNIQSVNDVSKCRVLYDGVLKGDDYISYVQKCHIGVCIQDPKDKFNLYEFPSKIFSYMSNGLNVVVNDLEQIRHSRIKDYLFISDSYYPEAVARSIINASKSQIDTQSILESLNEEFKSNLKQLVKGV